MNRTNQNPDPSFWREVTGAYGFAILMFALAIIPGLNFTYSGHGGISWFFVPLCFPWVVGRALFKITKGAEHSRRWQKRFFAITIPSYFALALPLSWTAATSIRMTLGLSITTWNFFAPDGLAFSVVVFQMTSTREGNLHPRRGMHHLV